MAVPPPPSPRPTPASRPGSADPPPRVVVLGSTGSIGVNTLAVIQHLNRSGTRPLNIVGLAAGGNVRRLAQQVDELANPDLAVAIARPEVDPDGVEGLQSRCAQVLTGADAALALIQQTRPDIVVAAIVGIAGLPATLAAVERGCTVALANKETLVAAGRLVMSRAEACGATLVPIDSEHSAIFQCLAGQLSARQVRRITLTASGGPFREADPQTIREATPEQAPQPPHLGHGSQDQYRLGHDDEQGPRVDRGPPPVPHARGPTGRPDPPAVGGPQLRRISRSQRAGPVGSARHADPDPGGVDLAGACPRSRRFAGLGALESAGLCAARTPSVFLRCAWLTG